MSQVAHRSESLHFGNACANFAGSSAGYYSFLLIILSRTLISFLLPVLVNNKALLVVRYKGSYYFPDR